MLLDGLLAPVAVDQLPRARRMNLAALILTAVTASAALWTVHLSYRAIRIARDASVSADESAKSGKDAADAANRTAEAAKETAEEVRLGRQIDRLEARRSRLHEMAALVEDLQVAQPRVSASNAPMWTIPRNRLEALLAGVEGEFPLTHAVVMKATVIDARLQESRVELQEAIRKVQQQLYIIDTRTKPIRPRKGEEESIRLPRRDAEE